MSRSRTVAPVLTQWIGSLRQGAIPEDVLRDVRALRAVARLCRRFVREDPERPGDLLWGVHCNREDVESGMDPDEFALAVDRALSRLSAPSRGAGRRGT